MTDKALYKKLYRELKEYKDLGIHHLKKWDPQVPRSKDSPDVHQGLFYCKQSLETAKKLQKFTEGKGVAEMTSAERVST